MLLRTRINIGVVAAMVLVGISIEIVSSISLSNSERRGTDAAVTLQRALFQKGIITSLEEFSSEFSSLTRSRELRNTLKSGDTEKLPEIMLPTYNRLSTSGTLDQLLVTDKAGKIVSSHPDSLSKTSSQINIVEALSENKLKQGLVLDDQGRIVISAAMPLISRGKLIGTGVFSKNLNGLLLDFKTNAAMEVFVTDSNGSRKSVV